jgi:hypothetical protein
MGEFMKANLAGGFAALEKPEMKELGEEIKHLKEEKEKIDK